MLPFWLCTKSDHVSVSLDGTAISANAFTQRRSLETNSMRVRPQAYIILKRHDRTFAAPNMHPGLFPGQIFGAQPLNLPQYYKIPKPDWRILKLRLFWKDSVAKLGDLGWGRISVPNCLDHSHNPTLPSESWFWRAARNVSRGWWAAERRLRRLHEFWKAAKLCIWSFLIRKPSGSCIDKIAGKIHGRTIPCTR